MTGPRGIAHDARHARPSGEIGNLAAGIEALGARS